MVTDFFVSALHGFDVNDVWFQHDGVICHKSLTTIYLLLQTFDARLISQNGEGNWPPRSCDLTPLHYFLCGAIKEKCYADISETIEHLKDHNFKKGHENLSHRMKAL